MQPYPIYGDGVTPSGLENKHKAHNGRAGTRLKAAARERMDGLFEAAKQRKFELSKKSSSSQKASTTGQAASSSTLDGHSEAATPALSEQLGAFKNAMAQQVSELKEQLAQQLSDTQHGLKGLVDDAVGKHAQPLGQAGAGYLTSTDTLSDKDNANEVARLQEELRVAKVLGTATNNPRLTGVVLYY